nr:hypothetical protein [Tanacetum cinerariifolium]
MYGGGREAASVGLANSDLLRDQLLVSFDMKTERKVQLATKINNLTMQMLGSIDERRSFTPELEQRVRTDVMAYKTREELKAGLFLGFMVTVQCECLGKLLFLLDVLSRLLANSDLLRDQLLVSFDMKMEREVQLATKINNLTMQLLGSIDERRSFIRELEQRVRTDVMAYKTREELKDHGVGINNSLAESDKHTSLGEQVNNPHIVPEITTTTQTLISSQNQQVDNYD